MLIKAGADVNAHNSSALCYAVYKGYYKVRDVLINTGADVNLEKSTLRSALIKAVDSYRSETSSSKPAGHYRNCMETLIGVEVDVSQAGPEDIIIISIAAHLGFDEAVRLLIQSGADVNKIGQYQCSPLMEAVANGQVKCAKLLLGAGADVNFIHHSGVSPLMCVGVPLCVLSDPNGIYKLSNWRAERNFLSCVKLLLQSGAKINMRNASTITALKFRMAPHIYFHMCQLLYAAGETLGGTTDGESLPDCLRFEA